MICSGVRGEVAESGLDLVGDGPQRLAQCLGVLPAALGQVVLASASAAQRLSRGTHQRAGTNALVPSTTVGGDHHYRARVQDRADGDDGGFGVTEPAAGVQGQRTDGVGRADGAEVGRGQPYLAHAHGVGDDVGRACCQCRLLSGSETLLGVLQPSHESFDTLGQVLGTAPDHRGELGDQRVLLGLVAVGAIADERVNATHARTD